MMLSVVTISLLLNVLAPAQTPAPPPAPVAGANPGAEYQDDADQQFRLLTAAYELDANAQILLREELQRRMTAQEIWDTAVQEKMDDLNRRMLEAQAPEGSKQDLEFEAELLALYDEMPLAPTQLATWVEGQMSLADASAGRIRYQELRQREDNRLAIRDDDASQMGGMKKAFIDEKRGDTAQMSPGKSPLPVGPKGDAVAGAARAKTEQARVVKPNNMADGVTKPKPKASPAAPPPGKLEAQPPPPVPTEPPLGPVAPGTSPKKENKQPGVPKVDAAQPPAKSPAMPESSKPGEPGAPKTDKKKSEAGEKPHAEPASADKPHAEADLPKAPPLDEWDRHVIATAEKYRFTDEQITKARAILQELRQRASQYRLSHATDYAHAEQIKDSKVRGERVAQLNKPLNALFDELKRRLESLPTTDQRRQAGTPGKAPAAPAKSDASKTPAKAEPAKAAPAKPKK